MSPEVFLLLNLGWRFTTSAPSGRTRWISSVPGNSCLRRRFIASGQHTGTNCLMIMGASARGPCLGGLDRSSLVPARQFARMGSLVYSGFLSASHALTALLWGRWQAKLSKDPLGPASPYLHRVPVHTLDTNNAQ
jgi:hypothetical protein